MTNTSVKVFQSTDSGAPVLSGTAGALIGVLDACLQNGYGEVTIDSLVVASDVATVTDSTGHGFTMLGAVGPVVRISGATPSALNGDWRITVTSTTQFTFVTTGISDQTASGTIVCKRAPAGFTKAFSGTNLAAYRSDDVTGTRLYLRVEDTGTTSATTIMYEVMTDADTGTGLAPTTGNLLVEKLSYWQIIADSKMIYCFFGSSASSWQSGLVFGDPIPYKSGDAYHSLMIGSISLYGSYHNALLFANSTDAAWFARSYTQLGSAVSSARYSHYNNNGSIGAGTQVYPNPVDNSLHVAPIECWQGTSYARGIMPGLYSPIHALQSGLNGSVLSDFPGLPNHSMLYKIIGQGGFVGAIALDISGPWR